jgi:hypothetical protein
MARLLQLLTVSTSALEALLASILWTILISFPRTAAKRAETDAGTYRKIQDLFTREGSQSIACGIRVSHDLQSEIWL